MNRTKRWAALALLLAAACALAACSAPSPAPAEVPAPSSAPTPEPTPEPPHVHDYDPETGLCRLCGESCPHDGGFDECFRCRLCGMACPHSVFSEDSVCLACGWVCPHENHDPVSALCLVCGAQRWHRFGIAGRCACGREAPLVDGMLSEDYFLPAEHVGTCFQETLSDIYGREHTIAVWLPWDYNEKTRYNLVLLIHGDSGSCDDWTDKPEPTSWGPIQMFRVYDRIWEQHLCAPFIVVGLNNAGMAQDPSFGEMLIEDLVLPHMFRFYSTYMEDYHHEDLVAARDHTAIGGLSRGSMFAYSIGMQRCLDVAANFCCFNNGYYGSLGQTLNSEEMQGYDVRSYVAEIGLQDIEEYNRSHRALYDSLCAEVERITEGENAVFLEIDEGHNFLMWSAAIYNALLLMF